MTGNRDSRATVTGCGGVTALTADFFKLKFPLPNCHFLTFTVFFLQSNQASMVHLLHLTAYDSLSIDEQNAFKYDSEQYHGGRQECTISGQGHLKAIRNRTRTRH